MKKQINMKKYSSEFKLCVIMDLITNKLGYKETMRKYEIKGCHTIQDWEKMYLKNGESGLMTTNKTRKSNKNVDELKIKKVTTKGTKEESLEEKCFRLEMEVEYLKKLRALIQLEEEKKKKRK